MLTSSAGARSSPPLTAAPGLSRGPPHVPSLALSGRGRGGSRLFGSPTAASSVASRSRGDGGARGVERRHEGRVGCGRVGGGPREARGVGPRQAHGARRDPARGPAAARRDAAVRGADAADSSGSVRGPGDRVPEVLLKQNFVLENIQGQFFNSKLTLNHFISSDKDSKFCLLNLNPSGVTVTNSWRGFSLGT